MLVQFLQRYLQPPSRSRGTEEPAKDNSLTLRAAVLDCFQRNRMNEFSDCGYNQIQQNNRFSTHKLMLSLIYRLNATRSKYKGTGAGKDAQARMGS